MARKTFRREAWCVGTLCQTRDGRRVGNGIVVDIHAPPSVPGTDHLGTLYTVLTDYGLLMRRKTQKDMLDMFHYPKDVVDVEMWMINRDKAAGR